jgi:sialate O-acetylesterase
VVADAINDSGWVKPDAENIDKFSAIGYFIAHQVTELTDNGIPVGITQISANGRPLSVFMPNHLAEELQTDTLKKVNVNVDGETVQREIYVDPNYTSVVETRYMYNHYINPFERMPIAGIVWYQGESESKRELSSVYVERFTALMEYMRSTHNLVNKEFPVFFVEYPSVYKVDGSDAYLDTGRIRATIGMIPNSLSNSYVAVCADLWNDKTNDNNIHPYCKYEQAERVTALMQAVIYGGKTLDEATGPLLESYEVSKDKKTVVLKFTNCGEGLTTADGGTVVNGFGGMNNKNAIHYGCIATAEITAPDSITVTFSRSTLGIAYNFVDSNFYGVDMNLCDSYGNPAQGIWIYFGPSN